MQKHRDQGRKDANACPYINPPIALAEVLWHEGRVRDPVIIAAALLHDTLEDAETTSEELRGRTLADGQTAEGNLALAERRGTSGDFPTSYWGLRSRTRDMRESTPLRAMNPW